MSIALHMPTIHINDDAAGLRSYAFDLPAVCTMRRYLKTILCERARRPSMDVILYAYYIIIILLCTMVIIIILIFNRQ